MFKGIISIFQAIKCALDEKNRQSRQFKQKQNEIYREGLTEVKLNEQIANIVDEMYADDTVLSVTIKVDQAALPFLSAALSRLHCEVSECADPTEFMLFKDHTYV